MRISMELSLYPLTDNYIPTIKAYLDHLNAHGNISVHTNAISTQVFGEYDDVMHAVNEATKNTLESGLVFALVSKMLSVDRSTSDYHKP